MELFFYYSTVSRMRCGNDDVKVKQFLIEIITMIQEFYQCSFRNII